MGQDRVGVLLRVVAGVALVLVGLVADGVGLLLGKADDLLVTGEDHGLLLGVGDDGVGLLLGAVQGLLLLLDDATGGLELVREDAAHLVQDLVEVIDLDDLPAGTTGEGALGLLEQLLHLVDELGDLCTWLHPGLLSNQRASARRAARGQAPRAVVFFILADWGAAAQTSRQRQERTCGPVRLGAVVLPEALVHAGRDQAAHVGPHG